MSKFIFALLVQSWGHFAVNATVFPPPIYSNALQHVNAYLNEPSASAAQKILNELDSLQPKGLLYVDKVLELIGHEETSWKNYDDRCNRLLRHLRQVVDASPIWVSFHRSLLKQTIHLNAQKLLNRCKTHARSDILYIYDRLKLWDQSEKGLCEIHLVNFEVP